MKVLTSATGQLWLFRSSVRPSSSPLTLSETPRRRRATLRRTAAGARAYRRAHPWLQERSRSEHFPALSSAPLPPLAVAVAVAASSREKRWAQAAVAPLAGSSRRKHAQRI